MKHGSGFSGPLPAAMAATDDAVWQRILSLSEAMLEGARQAEWERIGRFHAERERLLRQFFAVPRTPEQLVGIEPGIRRILQADREIAQAGSQARDALAGELRQLRQGRLASRAYRADA